ncbi:hypothetical protein KIW84_030918 [Lathyrus oleraceus]|uniref:DUF7745 domain-containing protein n=1 Tax=Pisum sativum TaxID=3888 RepID=A0A9D4XR37_PEA|nr:hypothetical protein KIW84_030918 [Pisum sativum]
MEFGKRKTLHIKIRESKTDDLRKYAMSLSKNKRNSLNYKYGRILDLLSVPVQKEALTSLAQFFDHTLRVWRQRDECKDIWLNSTKRQKEAKEEYEARIQALEAEVQSLVNIPREARSQAMDSKLQRRVAEGLLVIHILNGVNPMKRHIQASEGDLLLPQAKDNLTLRPPYQTRAHQKKTMKQIKQNQDALREDINLVKGNVEGMKDKIDQLARVITNMMAREAEADKMKDASTSTSISVDSNPPARIHL